MRVTHLPTNVVVQCQNERSQHKNKATAMKQLKAKLLQLEEQKRRAETQALEDTKADNSWGSQIRSYVLDQSRIKDLRTGVETGNPDDVLNGDLDRRNRSIAWLRSGGASSRRCAQQASGFRTGSGAPPLPARSMPPMNPTGPRHWRLQASK